jgi:exosome complex component RRP42
MKEMPVGITIAKIGSKLMVDPSLDEEAVCETKLTIVSSSDGSVAGMQKMGISPLTEAELFEAIDLASKRQPNSGDSTLKGLQKVSKSGRIN